MPAFNHHKQQLVSEASAQASALATTNPTETQAQAGPVESNSIWRFFDQQVAKTASRRIPTVSAISEIDQYLKLPVLNRKSDPLEWWKENGNLFPSLSILARKYLTVIATSVPSERLFSTAGELISARRSRLKLENVDMLLFLNKSV